jgi:pimeloyl-ACP methyl ester carboxylesterase
MPDRPRILLVPTLTELEWQIKPLLEEWADVASYDAPGVGDEPPPDEYNLDAIRDRGLAELDRRGWSDAVIVSDEYGSYNSVNIASARPECVRALALGHACLSFRRDGDRATVNREVMGAFFSLLTTDYRTYVRHLTQVTQGAYDEELTDRYIERVPPEVARSYVGFVLAEENNPLEPTLRALGKPMLLAKHDGCLGWSDESFDDVVAAFPDAPTSITSDKPSVSPEFAEALREFCADVLATSARGVASDSS